MQIRYVLYAMFLLTNQSDVNKLDSVNSQTSEVYRGLRLDIDAIIVRLKQLRQEGYEKYITFNGARIRYAVIGAGPTVVLLHGLGGFLETWGLNMIPLSDHYKVYALDLPGHGLSDKLEGCYIPDCATGFLTNIMDKLGIERATLIGHSLGGAISINTAANFPNRVDKLVLVSSAGLSRKVPTSYRLLSMPLLGKFTIMLAGKYLLNRGMRNLFHKLDYVSTDIRSLVMASPYKPLKAEDLLGIARHNVGIGGLRQHSLMIDKLPSIRTQTLFIHGARDKVFPLEHVNKSFSLVPNAIVKLFNYCGHLPHVERPLKFNETVLSFLNKQDA
jgi:pimeloyl-ACP methyl ester carboxylesterase